VLVLVVGRAARPAQPGQDQAVDAAAGA
jgi:hypothetical protein